MLQNQLTFDTRPIRNPIKSYEYNWKFARLKNILSIILLLSLMILMVAVVSWLIALSPEYNYLLKTLNGIC